MINSSLTFLIVAFILFAFTLYETIRTKQGNTLYGNGFFLFVLQFILLPVTLEFIAWIMAFEQPNVHLSYVFALFISSIILAGVQLIRSYPEYMKKKKAS